MKKFLLFLIIALIPQNVLAEDDVSFFGSLENRGALLDKNSIPIAEHKAIAPLTDRLPLSLDFESDHYFKAGAGFNWRGFDIGAYYTKSNSSHSLKNKFKNTFPLNTATHNGGPIVEGATGDGPSSQDDEYGGFGSGTGGDDDWQRIDPDDPVTFNNNKVSSEMSLDVANVDPGGPEKIEHLINPDYFKTDTATGTAQGEFNYQHFDFEVGALFKMGDVGLRFSAGARYAKYEQSLNVTRTGRWYCYDGFNAVGDPAIECDDPNEVFLSEWGDELDFHSPSYANQRNLDMEIEAFGPRIGLTLSAPLTKNITLIGAANWAILFGERDITDNYIRKKTTRIIKKNGEEAVAEIPAEVGSGTVAEPEFPLIPAVPAVPPVYDKDRVQTYTQGGYVEKDKDTTIHNLEFEAGLEYTLKLGKKTALSFLAGYRYDVHYGAMTTCGGSKILDDPAKPETQKTFGSCAKRLPNGSLPHAVDGEDYISHGPFIKTSFTF